MTRSVLPPSGELLRRHGLSPRKSFGQNFLHAPEVLESIVRACDVGPGDRIIEIGCGLGALTGVLLARGARVEGIERDRDLCTVLRKELEGNEAFRLHEADAVRFDYATLASEDDPLPVVGNLPYQITGPLLFALLEHHARTQSWIVMVQKEVGDRLAAGPGSKTYGAPSVTIGHLRSVLKVCNVGRGSFIPPPRVDSLVLKLSPREQPRGEVPDEVAFRELVRTAFSQRRKTLANTLKALAPREVVLGWCEASSVDPGRRPETLEIEEFAALARARHSDAGTP